MHKNRWSFEIGVKQTQVKLTPKAPAAGGKDWSVALEVTTSDGQPVDAGEVKLGVDQGALSSDNVVLAGGKGSIAWSPPASIKRPGHHQGQIPGDQADPAQPDRKYKPSQAELKLPPGAKPTQVRVTASPVTPGDDSVFIIRCRWWTRVALWQAKAP